MIIEISDGQATVIIPALKSKRKCENTIVYATNGPPKVRTFTIPELIKLLELGSGIEDQEAQLFHVVAEITNALPGGCPTPKLYCHTFDDGFIISWFDGGYYHFFARLEHVKGDTTLYVYEGLSTYQTGYEKLKSLCEKYHLVFDSGPRLTFGSNPAETRGD